MQRTPSRGPNLTQPDPCCKKNYRESVLGGAGALVVVLGEVVNAQRRRWRRPEQHHRGKKSAAGGTLAVALCWRWRWPRVASRRPRRRTSVLPRPDGGRPTFDHHERVAPLADSVPLGDAVEAAANPHPFTTSLITTSSPVPGARPGAARARPAGRAAGGRGQSGARPAAQQQRPAAR